MGLSPVPFPKLSQLRSSTNPLGRASSGHHSMAGARVEQRGPTPQDAPNARGVRRPERRAPKAGEATFPPKSARWKLLPLAFPLAKAASGRDPSLRA